MKETPATDNWTEVEAASQSVLPKSVLRHIEKTKKLPNPESYLIAVLHTLQDTLGFLGEAQIDAVAQLMGIPAAKVSGVATFYHYFRSRPPGRFVISLCLGTACYVKGGTAVLDAIKKELNVEVGETTKDGIFSLQEARCLGTCGLAPVMMIEGKVHPRLKPEQIPEILADYRRQAVAAPMRPDAMA